LEKWMRKYSDPGGNLDHVIGNLFWRGYLDIRYRDDSGKSVLYNRNVNAIPSRELVNDKFDGGTTKFRITKEGLVVGEVLAEVYNSNRLLRFLNRYKYALVIDLLWLSLAIILLKLLWGTEKLEAYISLIDLGWSGYSLDQGLSVLIAVFVLIPAVSWVIRKAYFFLENPDLL